jgi:hypothetical protein
MENYIRNQIVSHFEKHQIEINDEDILSIIDQTKKGVYAFQIIYVDNPDIFDEETINEEMQCIEDSLIYREKVEPELNNKVGRQYFHGQDVYGNKFLDHQKP